ncbi:hypothetical protein ACUOCP_42130, partial [Escherichia sp. R-CC3]
CANSLLALKQHAGIAHWHMQPVLRQVGDLERILARLALRTARPRDLARMRHAFQQLPELRAQLETVDSAPVQALREKMGEFAELRDLLERAIIDTPPSRTSTGGVSMIARSSRSRSSANSP